ncbi:MAG: T9SS type A sorting domain-containing protein [Flavobacteriales bacterium]|nr:T9SS type A sorting domain-containing protein [Flavobacteriales bacterium]MCB0783207.1 T9SS type A sorting domain-containing protein [Flavobacteriales bacterium]
MRTTLTLSTLLVATGLYAQVTLTYSMLDQAGVTASMHLVTSPGSAQPPSDGINQTWDFSTVTLSQLGTMAMVPAAGTPYAASYPAANWAFEQTVTGVGTDYTYLKIDPTTLILLADEVPSDPNPYSDAKHILHFPMAYGDSFSDAWADTEGSGNVTWTYSGHGTAITPLGTYTNVAKVASNEGDVLLWNTSPLYPLVIADGNGTLFFGPSLTGVQELGGQSLTLTPNPCEDELTLRQIGTGQAWSIVDAQGRQVMAGRTTTTDLVVDVRELLPGTYALQVRTAEGRRIGRFVKQ